MYDNIISLDNLLIAWQEFLCGKKNKKDTQEFGRNLMHNIIALHNDLKNKTYKHGEYKSFKISDPKPRDIHNSSVRDRLLHHAIYRVLYPHFDKKFVHDSYSCRLGKGTHIANERFRYFAGKVSKNYTRSCWVLKCDIRKFFANIDHKILTEILERNIEDKDIYPPSFVIPAEAGELGEGPKRKDGGGRTESWSGDFLAEKYSGLQSENTDLDSREYTRMTGEDKSLIKNDTILLLKEVVGSFNTKDRENVGLPLGNLTSQLLVNIYMNEFDQFVKHELKEKYYIRYADDFVFMSENKTHFEKLISKILLFLQKELKLEIHPDKLYIKTLSSGLDFLGWIHFLKHKVLRTTTKKRMFRNIIKKEGKKETTQSYLGMLKHGNTNKLKEEIYKINIRFHQNENETRIC
jgi:RNA-directed DNA polymerase